MSMLAHHFLSGRVRALVHDFEWMGHDIHEFLITQSDTEVSTLEDAE